MDTTKYIMQPLETTDFEDALLALLHTDNGYKCDYCDNHYYDPDSSARCEGWTALLPADEPWVCVECASLDCGEIHDVANVKKLACRDCSEGLRVEAASLRQDIYDK